MFLVPGLAQLRDCDQGRHDPDRDVDEEDPAPGQVIRQHAADQGADGDGGARDRAPDPERGAAFAALELLREQRQRGGEHDRSADTLTGTREDQEQR